MFQASCSHFIRVTDVGDGYVLGDHKHHGTREL